ncbi:MAG TPA: hypothetical protein VFI25_10795 [Planctomycetota bacterium]|jgi:hypothetical protein|nr:hypothetical protein [Planctomycetota bacterium]
MTLLVLLGIPVLVGLAPAQETRPDEDLVAAQREKNERFFLSDYLERREGLVERSAGKWIAIVAGESTSPAETFADCLRAADARDAKALHRFVFRIGEEGPVAYRVGGATDPNLVGLRFFGYLDIHPMEFKFADGQLTCWRGERSKVFRIEDNRIPLLLGVPGGTSVRPIRVGASTGFTGIAVFDAASASELGLTRFEIPGEVTLDGSFGRSVCRRARMRVQIPELEIDEILPVAVWKR